MGSRIIYKRASVQEYSEIVELLQTCFLPSGDLTREKITNFLIAKTGGKIIGTIGLEFFRKEALLRSMAVLPEYRSKGVASRLLKHILQVAHKSNILHLHLLTTTAKDYFSRKGFKTIAKEFAPDPILVTTEFVDPYPASSTYMVMPLFSNLSRPVLR